ncbi:MAG: hypothetical protein IGS54_11780 [Elainella sp. C42_A2020_010]|nr:hypothetical protein [Elainella sp. C42_A2020_010]RNJ66647.1 MAG: hypothetical protein EDM05_24710 [Leptolyngbya sp. IPPAS B-1204]
MDSYNNLAKPIPNILLQFKRTLNLFIHSLHQHIVTVPQVLLTPLQTRIQQCINSRLQQHPCGYCYIPIFCNRLGELLILQWVAGSESKPHSHLASINFTKVLSGQVLERKYHISGGQLRVISERVVQAGQWAWTFPFEIHELVALDKSAETMHIYLPGRGY